MILPDVNVLIYAYNSASRHHERCAEWLESILNGDSAVCFSWHTILGFVRIVTTVRMVPRPFSAVEAMEIADELLRSPVSKMLIPGDGHFGIFRQLVLDSGISGARLADAHIAALAIEHGATVASADRDFRVFDGLKLIDPLSQH
ncbi:MAG TPA: PIN domain-containing protein [Pyrinomonadaceae bacterium]|nr:PIN domain-containing protein [Pyrinomonadaceae bacterium]HMP64327.1 PIN domain-containing protein [Pyrinomonadaceae bacterium]